MLAEILSLFRQNHHFACFYHKTKLSELILSLEYDCVAIATQMPWMLLDETSTHILSVQVLYSINWGVGLDLNLPPLDTPLRLF